MTRTLVMRNIIEIVTISWQRPLIQNENNVIDMCKIVGIRIRRPGRWGTIKCALDDTA
jgi:hypothetical protein